MIQIEKIRLNKNNIYSNNGVKLIPIIFTDQDFFDCILGRLSFSNYEYIKLTPKLLENFGFIVKNTFLNCIELSLKNPPNDLLNCSRLVIKLGDNRYKYIHQIQNLFYSLTGIELNDVVAYNYYKTKLNPKDGEYYITFNEFINNEKITKDLPKTLFDE